MALQVNTEERKPVWKITRPAPGGCDPSTFADIRVTYHGDEFLPGFRSRPVYSYEWKGPRTAPTMLDRHRGEEFEQIPWPMAQVGEEDFRYRSAPFVRLDVVPGLAHYWRIRLGGKRWLRTLKERTIATLAIWNLATMSPERYPSWSDVKRPFRRAKPRP